MKTSDIIIIGAGAAGLMCAIEAGKRGRRVIVLDHANKPGKKILMSGGGRCNFTNKHVSSEQFISHNPHFCKSALSRYTPEDFIALVKHYKIPFHEKTLGQLFCDNKSKDIVTMLLNECEKANVDIQLNTTIKTIKNSADYRFEVITDYHTYQCESLVIASGGLSIPTMGASPFAYKVAEQFGIKIWPTRAGLVPFTLHKNDLEKFSILSGVSFNSIVENIRQGFKENSLFTHRGLSGPAMLQMSSYWHAGEPLTINMLPDINLADAIQTQKQSNPKENIKTFMNKLLAKRIVDILLPPSLANITIGDLSQANIAQLSALFNHWSMKPNGTEGYRTAEVTLGGIDCNTLSSKTMEVAQVPGLYFIGEAIDVTGWLGGYNFQWAWSSAVAAGKVA